MTNSLLNRFFEPLEPVLFNNGEADYSKLDYVVKLLNCINDILPHNSYIIDYYHRNFFFISKQSIFLCGYKEEEVMKMGYDFYSKILSSEDLEKLIEINKVGFDLFYELPDEERTAPSISYDLLLHKKSGGSFCVTHRLKPFLFTPDNNIWLSVCCLRQSPSNQTGNVTCFFKESEKRYSYSFKTKKWTELPSINLTATEQIIAMETDKGTLEKQLANQLGCTRSTIRYYKSQILKKTQKDSIREAILFLFSNDII